MTKEIEPISSELQEKIKTCDPDVQDFIRDLRSELLKLHKRNLGLEAKNVSLSERINALKVLEVEDKIQHMTDDEIREKAKEMIKDLFEQFKAKKEGCEETGDDA
jgi:basic membrane lipoprotein Med (substrate-binding protein (PBP1-ABC) superfamily)